VVIPLRDDNPTQRKAVVTVLLIVACAAVFFLVQPRSGGNEETQFLVEHAAIPCEITNGEALTNEVSAGCDGNIFSPQLGPEEKFFEDKNPYVAMLVSMFLHGSILHLAGNLLFLWVFGNNIEDRFGWAGYSALYLVGGVGATLAHVYLNPDSTTPVIGASGAIAAVMGAYLVEFPRARILTVVPLFIFLQFLHLPAYIVLVGWFVLQFFTGPNTGVATAAHIAGFAIGALIAGLARPFSRRGDEPPENPQWGFGSTYR
jgi:membrane associated rhomboid family serine protease